MHRIIFTHFSLIFGLLLLLSSSLYSQSVVEIPFNIDRGCLYVEATYRGSEPFSLMLSFNHPSAIDITNRAFQFNDDRGRRIPNGVSGTTTPQTTLSGLKLGSYLVEREMDYFWDQPYGFGRRFFDGKIVQFDFQRKVMRILGQESSLKGDQLATLKKDSVTVEFKTSEENEVKPKTYLTTRAVSISGKQVTASLAIDVWEFIFAPRVDSSGKINGVPTYTVEKATVKFGDLEVKDVDVLRTDSKKFEYVLASNFFKRFITTFDFKSKRVRIDPIAKTK